VLDDLVVEVSYGEMHDLEILVGEVFTGQEATLASCSCAPLILESFKLSSPKLCNKGRDNEPSQSAIDEGAGLASM
jgi:hypothetical protein